MKDIIRTSILLQKVVLTIMVLVNVILFLATGHEVDFGSLEILKFIGMIALFGTLFFLLDELIKNGISKGNYALYISIIFFAFSALLYFLYILYELISVKYGDDKPYLIFLVILFAIMNSLVLMLIFIFKRKQLLDLFPPHFAS